VLYTSHIDTPLGGVTLAATDDGLAGLWFDQQRHLPDTGRLADRRHHPVLVGPRRNCATTSPARAITSTAARPVARHRLPAGRVAGAARDSRGQDQLRRAERRVGKPAAVRAVGAAVGRNPISVIVPCHRVLGSDGSLTGYAGGLHRKTALLELEGAR
jgi:methylated-DNA-[protein]-cysteine S-methyltransferase